MSTRAMPSESNLSETKDSESNGEQITKKHICFYTEKLGENRLCLLKKIGLFFLFCYPLIIFALVTTEVVIFFVKRLLYPCIENYQFSTIPMDKCLRSLLPYIHLACLYIGCVRVFILDRYW